MSGVQEANLCCTFYRENANTTPIQKVWYTTFMKPKPLIFLLFLVSCAPVEMPAPEIIYVVITTTPEPTPTEQQVSPEFYFNSWEIAKDSTPPASGQFWYLGEHEYMLFATDEESGLHELGHLVDSEREYPSNSIELQNAIYEYLFNTDIPESELELHHYLFVAYSDGLFGDAFAELYMWNILYELPKGFIDFY